MKKKDMEMSITVGDKTVETSVEGLEKATNEIKSMDNIFKEAKGQIENLLQTHHLNIYKAYKENGNELKVNLSIGLKGDSQFVNVKTTLSFVAEKITDELEGLINLNQPELPLKED